MSNSGLVDVKVYSPHHSGRRYEKAIWIIVSVALGAAVTLILTTIGLQ